MDQVCVEMTHCVLDTDTVTDISVTLLPVCSDLPKGSWTITPFMEQVCMFATLLSMRQSKKPERNFKIGGRSLLLKFVS